MLPPDPLQAPHRLSMYGPAGEGGTCGLDSLTREILAGPLHQARTHGEHS